MKGLGWSWPIQGKGPIRTLFPALHTDPEALATCSLLSKCKESVTPVPHNPSLFCQWDWDYGESVWQVSQAPHPCTTKSQACFRPLSAENIVVCTCAEPLRLHCALKLPGRLDCGHREGRGKWDELREEHWHIHTAAAAAAAAAAAKSLQSCPTRCDPIDDSPPGSPGPGILQARALERVAISFSNARKWKVKVKSLSHVWLLATPWTAAYQAPPSMGFSKQEYWSGVPLPSPDIYTLACVK